MAIIENGPPNLPPDPVTPVPLPEVKRRPMPGYTTLAVLLAGLSMLGPFSIDTYLPAFPEIQASLRATPVEVQQTLTAYMLSFAAMVLWHGALADAFGRRNVILVALVLFAIGSLGCAAAHSVHYLWAFRILQGVSAGAGVVVGRAIIRDLYSDARATRLLSLVTMIFTIAPAIAPILGGWIVQWLDWRSIFLFLLLYTIGMFVFCYYRLPETLPAERRQPFNPRFLWQSYRDIFMSPLFHLKAGVVAFNFGGMFLYVTSAPVLLPEHLGLGPHQFGYLFVPQVSGIFLGAFAANRLAGKMAPKRQVALGFAFLLTAAGANVLIQLFNPPTVVGTIAPLFFYTFGMAVIAPVATLLALDLFPHIRGTVASCQSFAQTMLGSLVAGVISPFLSHSVLWLAAGQAAMTLAALACWILALAYHRRRAWH